MSDGDGPQDGSTHRFGMVSVLGVLGCDGMIGALCMGINSKVAREKMLILLRWVSGEYEGARCTNYSAVAAIDLSHCEMVQEVMSNCVPSGWETASL